jgi:hypothetical protein
MHKCAIGVIHVEGAAGAAFLPVRTKHEVIDDELASPVEQVGERFLAARRIEDIVLFDFDPGKLAALGGNGVALARELLLFGQ